MENCERSGVLLQLGLAGLVPVHGFHILEHDGFVENLLATKKIDVSGHFRVAVVDNFTNIVAFLELPNQGPDGCLEEQVKDKGNQETQEGATDAKVELKHRKSSFFRETLENACKN